MRIAVVAPSVECLGGQAILAAAQTSYLRADGHDVTFVPVNPRVPAAVAWTSKVKGARTVAVQAAFLPTLTRLKHASVAHIFSASYWSFLLAPTPAMIAARRYGVKVVLNYHSGEADDHLGRWGWRVQPWLRLADEIVVSSTYLHEVFARHGFRTTIIPAAVDTGAFRYRERGGGLRCLSVRNLAPYYRIDTIVQAFARIHARRRGATLTVAGIGPLDRDVRAMARALGVADAVQFLGRVEPYDVPQLYADADMLLNASVVDNQPGSILEAFAAGLPVVSTPTGGIAELVRNGRTGLTVPPNDPERMADVAVWLADHPSIGRELGRRAHALVREFTWEATRDRWAAVYGASRDARHATPAARAV